MTRSGDVEIEHVAEPIPRETRLLHRRAAAFRVGPVGVVIRAALVGRREAEGRELGVGARRAERVHRRADHARHVAVAADEMVAEIAALGPVVGDRASQRFAAARRRDRGFAPFPAGRSPAACDRSGSRACSWDRSSGCRVDRRTGCRAIRCRCARSETRPPICRCGSRSSGDWSRRGSRRTAPIASGARRDSRGACSSPPARTASSFGTHPRGMRPGCVRAWR